MQEPANEKSQEKFTTSNTSKKLTGLDNFLLKYSIFIDDVDMYLSPTSTLTLWHDNSNIKNLGLIATIIDLGLLKTPFVILYTLKTKDYKSPIEWLGWETLAHALPYEGGLLNIRRNYETSTKEHYQIANK
ncbi:MAG: hypothetical protein WC758_01900 [Candidatus Woesearchaeota archaeon]|jgi:hypothetical protein